MKRCFKCGLEKPFSEYYRHGRMADGFLNKCKECTKADVAKHRGDNLDAVRAYDRQRGRSSERKEANRIRLVAYRRLIAGKQVQKRYREKYPEKILAKNAVNNAIRDGKLARQPCEVCGKKAEAHHEDYSKPLEVRWLCRTHHAEQHRKYKD